MVSVTMDKKKELYLKYLIEINQQIKLAEFELKEKEKELKDKLSKKFNLEPEEEFFLSVKADEKLEYCYMCGKKSKKIICKDCLAKKYNKKLKKVFKNEI